jgi:hypothetical protein
LFFKGGFFALKHFDGHLEFGDILGELIFFVLDFGGQVIQLVDCGVDSVDFE